MDTGPNLVGLLPNNLVMNGVYTIRMVDDRHPAGLVGLHLVEATAASIYGYWVVRFRPVVPRTQSEDVEMVKSLLTKVGEPA